MNKNFIKHIDNFIKNKTISNILSIILIIYSSIIVQNILHSNNQYTVYIVNLFNNKFYKIFLFLLIGYVAQINYKLSIFLLIATMITIDTVMKYELNQQIKQSILVNNEIKLNKISSKSSNSSSKNTKQSENIKQYENINEDYNNSENINEDYNNSENINDSINDFDNNMQYADF